MQKGFSLIEMLVALSILSVVVLVLIQSFVTTTRGSVKTEISSDVKTSGDFALRMMENTIRSTTGIASCTGSSTKTLTFDNPDGTSTTYACSYDAGNAISRIAGTTAGVLGYLTPVSVTLGGNSCAASTLAFICTSTPGLPDVVQINFSLSQRGVPPDKFQQAKISFQTTVNVRN